MRRNEPAQDVGSIRRGPEVVDDHTTVLIAGAGPAGLVLGNLLRAEGGVLGPRSVRASARHGPGAGTLHLGRSRGVCAFRREDGEFELDYGRVAPSTFSPAVPRSSLMTTKL